MSASDQTPPPVAAERRSKQIALVLLGTMGVVGGAAVWEAWQRAGLENNSTVTPPATPAAPLAADRDYPNNDFTPGVGYYHAPYRSWFPFPFNHHDPSRGFFGGGLWQAAPFAAGLLSSRPTGDAVTSALAAQQGDDVASCMLRWVHHIKIVCQAGHAVQAKAYLALEHHLFDRQHLKAVIAATRAEATRLERDATAAETACGISGEGGVTDR